MFANGQVKIANKRYTSIKNDFCLTFGLETEIQECKEDTSIMASGYSFTKISQLKNCQNSMTVDVIGVIADIGSISSIKLKTGDNKDRLNIVIADDTNASVSVTVWGEICH